MSDSPNTGPKTPADMKSTGLGALASRALSVVASRGGRGTRPLREGFVFEMQNVALSFERRSFAPVLGRMTEAGIGPEEIADRYVPALARRLGDLWCEDEMSFAEVTIGTARLMGLLRDLGPEWRADVTLDGDAGAVLLLVAHDVHHTLGATVLAGQLRRRGLSVRSGIGLRPEEVGRLLVQARFDAVFVSSSRGENLETLRKLVDCVRKAASPVPPIVLGGTILDVHDLADLKALVGADLVTCDSDEALEICGLTIPSRTGARRLRGT